MNDDRFENGDIMGNDLKNDLNNLNNSIENSVESSNNSESSNITENKEEKVQSENITENLKINDENSNEDVSNSGRTDTSPVNYSEHVSNAAHTTSSPQTDNFNNGYQTQVKQNYNFVASPYQNQNSLNETQRVWQMNNYQGTNANSQNYNSQHNTHHNTQYYGNQNYNTPPYNNYYRESYKKNQKKSDAWKYILVSIISSIIGGAILTIMLLGVAPVVQPELKRFFGISSQSSSDNTQPQVGEIKRVEIVQTAESAVTSVAEKVGPSVVGIRTSYQYANDLFGVQQDGGEGSGIIISSDGYILTNHHVIERALNDKTRKVQAGAKIEVFLPNKIDKPYVADVKGYDSKTDLAVLKINESNLNAIEFGNSDELKIGEPAIAIGNPGGLEYMGSVTQGVISGLNRTVQLDGGRKIKLVQTDAAINPGNSGGALVNLEGQLIGVNTVKMVATGFEGLGFAIPVNDAKKIADELIKNTYIAKPYLGISVDQRYTEEIAEQNNMPMGVYVASVEILSAAEKAGIKAGDVITKFNGTAVKSYADLEDEKNKFKPGDTVSIEIYRDGKYKTVQVKLGETK